MKILLVIVFALSAAAFARNNLDLRIVNGSDAIRNQFPYQVLVADNAKDNYRGGSIIAQIWVVTVARFVSAYKPADLVVVAGALKRLETDAENEQSIQVDEIIMHPKYSNKTNAYDISLLRLSSLLIYGPNVQPIPLAPKYYKAMGAATISGYGFPEYPYKVPPNTLQYAKVEIINKTGCETLLKGTEKYNLYNSSINLCTISQTTNGKQAACFGDEGGPLIIGNYLVGIISEVDNDCSNPTLYVKISAVRDWITDNLSKL